METREEILRYCDTIAKKMKKMSWGSRSDKCMKDAFYSFF